MSPIAILGISRAAPTCEMLMLLPFDPDTTMAFKLLYSVSDFFAEPPVLSRASFRILFTWFSNVCRSVLPGVGSSSMLCAFWITPITSSFAFRIAFWISVYVCGSAIVSPMPMLWPSSSSQLFTTVWMLP